jgi:hypothetical protein
MKQVNSSQPQEAPIRSKAAASKASDVAQVGLRRGGEPAFAQNKSKTHRAESLGGAPAIAQGSKRGGSNKIASYETASIRYDIGCKRAGDNNVPATPHPDTVAGNTRRAERPAMARNPKDWHGPDAADR